jgi:hypothetical protein
MLLGAAHAAFLPLPKGSSLEQSGYGAARATPFIES